VIGGGGTSGGGSAGMSGAGGSSSGGGGSGGTTGGSSGSSGMSGVGGTSGGGAAGTSGTFGGGAGGVAGTGGAPIDAGDPCPTLLAEVQAKLVEARRCCPACGAAYQCTGVADGVCCDVTVQNAASPATTSYLAALDKYTAQGCIPVCTRALCPVVPSGVCGLDGYCQ
jgi:hypothetical protein